MKFLTNDEVAERAQRWARFHKNEKYRDKMDEVLAGLNKIDQRRVYLCGQRMSGGLPLKVISAPAPEPRKEKGTSNDTKENSKRERGTAAADNGSGKAQGKVSVGTDSSVKKSGNRRSRSGGKK